MEAPDVAQRVTYEGVEYVVTRVQVLQRGRLQIDLIPVTEAERRYEDLGRLLNGQARA